MLYEANYFANSLGLRNLNSSPINGMSSSSSADPSLSPISKTNDSNFRNHQHHNHSNNSSIEKSAKKTKRSNVTPTVREVIENKLKRSHINSLIKQSEALNSETEWLNNSNEENLNQNHHHIDKQQPQQISRKCINKSNLNNLPYILNENDISNYLDMNIQQQQQSQPFRHNSLNQNDSVQNFSINSYTDVDCSTQYLNNSENSYYLNNMVQHSSQAGCAMENEFNHYAQYAIAENSNTLIPIYQQVPIEYSSANLSLTYNSDNAIHSDYNYNNMPHISNYEAQYNNQYYHHAPEYQQQEPLAYHHMNYYQYQDESNQISSESFFLNRENNHTNNIDAPNYTINYFGANNMSIMQKEKDIDNSDQQYAYNNQEITFNTDCQPSLQINESKNSTQTQFNISLRSLDKDYSYSDNDDDFSSIISQEEEEEILKEVPMVKVKTKAKNKLTKKPIAKKLSKIINIQPSSHDLNSNENSNSTESFLNSTLFSNQQYIQSQLEGVSCKRKRKRILNRLQRAEATMREKRRMLKLNRAFEELRKVLPVSDFAKNKLSRAETLKSAIEYIENMSELLSI